jgi:hypothetical protein
MSPHSTYIYVIVELVVLGVVSICDLISRLMTISSLALPQQLRDSATFSLSFFLLVLSYSKSHLVFPILLSLVHYPSAFALTLPFP